jgi:hypothetical protein
MTRRLILLLGDQLTPTIASLRVADKTRDIVLMCEVWEEATYVRHHKKKIALVFSAMRRFAELLRADGWQVDYRTLEETGAAGRMSSEIAQAALRHKPDRIVVTSPGEWRLLENLIFACLERDPAFRPEIAEILPVLNSMIASGPKMWPKTFNPGGTGGSSRDDDPSYETASGLKHSVAPHEPVPLSAYRSTKEACATRPDPVSGAANGR